MHTASRRTRKRHIPPVVGRELPLVQSACAARGRSGTGRAWQDRAGALSNSHADRGKPGREARMARRDDRDTRTMNASTPPTPGAARPGEDGSPGVLSRHSTGRLIHAALPRPILQAYLDQAPMRRGAQHPPRSRHSCFHQPGMRAVFTYRRKRRWLRAECSASLPSSLPRVSPARSPRQRRLRAEKKCTTCAARSATARREKATARRLI